MTSFTPNQDGVVVAVCGIQGIELWIFAEYNCSAANKNRRIVEGFGKLDQRLTGCNNDSTGVVLRFRVRIGGELGRLALCAKDRRGLYCSIGQSKREKTRKHTLKEDQKRAKLSLRRTYIIR